MENFSEVASKKDNKKMYLFSDVLVDVLYYFARHHISKGIITIIHHDHHHVC